LSNIFEKAKSNELSEKSNLCISPLIVYGLNSCKSIPIQFVIPISFNATTSCPVREPKHIAFFLFFINKLKYLFL